MSVDKQKLVVTVCVEYHEGDVLCDREEPQRGKRVGMSLGAILTGLSAIALLVLRYWDVATLAAHHILK